jgi:Protein of unknown function (DUF2795)
MDTAAASELKATLQGVTLPAEKSDLLEYAVRRRAEPVLLAALRTLPEREFESLDEVVEELVPVQPSRDDRRPSEPHEESGKPPGGDDYTVAHPTDTGQVPDLDEVEE